MANCGDCGTPLREGRCPNCQEELIIYEDQYLTMDNEEDMLELSEDFVNKVKEQKELLKSRLEV